MIRPDSLFGKRDNTTNTPGTPSAPNTPLGGNGPLMQTAPGSGPRVGAPLDRATSSTGSSSSDNSHASTNEVGSKLIVGPNIKLKGVEISDCDTLVVEGRVEATMNSRVIQIAEMGAFTGSAEVDLAEIRGDFDGELTVRQKLVIFGTGKVSGKIRYGKLVVEEGGQLSGDVQSGGVAATPRSLSVAKAAQ